MAKLSYVQVEVIQLCHIDLAAWCASPWYSALHVLMIRLVIFGLAQSVTGIVCNIDPLSVANGGSRCIANLLLFEHWKGSVELSHWLDASIVVCCIWIASAVLSIVLGLACYDPLHCFLRVIIVQVLNSFAKFSDMEVKLHCWTRVNETELFAIWGSAMVRRFEV
jgi:hypothetical protein